MGNSIIQKIYNTSIWFKILILVLIVVIYILVFHKHRTTEGFGQIEKYLMKEAGDIYDDFYVGLYNDLRYDDIKNEYEVGSIINKTNPDNNSVLLDIGSGTGEHVSLFKSKGIHSMGLDKSSSMVSLSKNKYPELSFTRGDATNGLIYKPHSFTHITCLYFTLYEIIDKAEFFSNCYEWLKPGGYLFIHLVDKDKFNPALKLGDPTGLLLHPILGDSTNKNTNIKFNNFKYRNEYEFKNNIGIIKETFCDLNKKVRKNVNKLHFSSKNKILNLARRMGFIEDGKISLSPVNYHNEYIYVLYKPE